MSVYAVNGSTIGAQNRTYTAKQGPAFTDILAAETTTTDTAARQDVPASTQGLKIDSLKLLRANLVATPIWELPEETYQRMIDAQERMLEIQHMQMPTPQEIANYAPIKPYATVVVNGKVVAELDNQGVMTTSNAMSWLGSKVPNELNGTNGPALAQARAEKIASLLGGKIVMAPTAMTQSAFNAIAPLEQLRPTVDVEAMQADPMYLSLQETKEKRAAYLAAQAA